MALKKAASWVVAILLGMLAVAPPIPYEFNLEVNSFIWVYLVVVVALVSFFMFTQKITLVIKIFMVYLFFNCFGSQVPYLSFTSYMVVVQTVLFFMLCLYVDFDPLLDVMQAVFWLEVCVMICQRMGYDTLMGFGGESKNVFFGTVFQQMRLGSLFAIMSPFLLIKNRLYIIPLAIVAISLGTLGFTFSLAAGMMVYVLLTMKDTKQKICIILWAFLFCAVAADTNNHIHIELIEGRWPIWRVIFRTWFLNTEKNFYGFNSPMNPSVQTGPFDWYRFLFGHGLNTFNAMFPFYKYDQNAFRPAHNDWLQNPWEIGLVGAAMLDTILFYVFYVTYKRKDYLLVVGLTIIACDRFLSFPDRMTQTNLLEVAFLAYCYAKHLNFLRLEAEHHANIKTPILDFSSRKFPFIPRLVFYYWLGVRTFLKRVDTFIKKY